MREQTIASRNSRRATTAGRDLAQRPARREWAGRRTERKPLRALLSYVPAALKFVVLFVAVIALFIGYRAAASAELFQVKRVDVTGTSRTSHEEIATLTRRAASRTGVWRANLSAISAELERLPGVRRAIVTRVLPDGLRVRIIERVPVAVVRTAAGHFLWVDEDGVALGEMKPSDQTPDFFVRGWSEDESEDARRENSERIQKYVELAREWGTAGLAARVSEVNLIDLRDVRAQLAGDDSQIEVRLGGQDPGPRLKYALDLLDERKQAGGGSRITYIDLTQGTRAFVGLTSGGKISADRPNPENQASASLLTSGPSRAGTTSRASSSDTTSTDVTRPRRAGEEERSRSRSSNNNSRERSPRH